MCLHAEGGVVVQFVSTFLNICSALAESESSGARDKLQLWDRVKNIIGDRK